MHLLLDQSHLLREDKHEDTWEEACNAKSIGRTTIPCRDYQTAKDNTMITMSSTSFSNPLSCRGQIQGQVVSFSAEIQEDTSKSGNSITLSLQKAVSEAYPTRIPQREGWLVSATLVFSTSWQATLIKSCLCLRQPRLDGVSRYTTKVILIRHDFGGSTSRARSKTSGKELLWLTFTGGLN